MTRKAAARTQHEPGLGPTGETEDGKGRGARFSKKTAGVAGPGPLVQQALMHGAQPAADSLVSSARAAWLETIRALARAAAKHDHAAALRQRQGDATKTGEQE